MPTILMQGQEFECIRKSPDNHETRFQTMFRISRSLLGNAKLGCRVGTSVYYSRQGHQGQFFMGTTNCNMIAEVWDELAQIIRSSNN